MKKLLFVLLLSLIALPGIASQTEQTPALTIFNTTTSAMLSVNTDKGNKLATQLQLKFKQQTANQSIQSLQQLIKNPEYNNIDVEYALWKLLKSTTAQNLQPEVLRYLANYSPRSRVLHPESNQASLPLFSIRATAAGTLKLQQREQDLLAAEKLEQQPEALLSLYLSRTPVSQTAIREAAKRLPQAAQQNLLSLSLEQLEDAARLHIPRLAITDLSAELALTQGNTEVLAQILLIADRNKLPRILHLISTKLSSDESTPLLYTALRQTPEIAAIAINYLGAIANTDIKVYQDMLDWLGQPGIGSAVALALSTNQQAGLQHDLSALILSSEPGQAMYAQLAIDLALENSKEAQQ